MATPTKRLHWTQRVALIRSSLHAASRSGDFTFFKSLQAAGMLEGTNHVAVLSAQMGDDVDTLLAAMDNLNAGLAYVHQDAFQRVYDGLKKSTREEADGETTYDSRKAKLHVDITMQCNIADLAIDKMTNSAVSLINGQSETFQESAASVWITGATIIADCIEVTLQQMQSLETKMNDFMRIEDSLNTVKASVVAAVTGLKGVFWLMDTNSQSSSPASSVASTSPLSASFASAGAGMFRRLSSAFSPSPSTSRSSSITSGALNASKTRTNSMSAVSNSAPVLRTPSYGRNSISGGCPKSMPPSFRSSFENFQSHLSPIPPTPALDDDKDPFDTSVAPPMPRMPTLPSMVVLPNTPLGENQGLAGMV